MSGTALYRALISAGADENQAKEAADDIDAIKTALTEIKISNRILIVLIIGLIIRSFFI